ncbi:glycoside hydrolase family 18 protein [Crossiella sp. CA-258035]|uniref:glycoside hydrolase family 18 protein n=1 Tax=Crossiella sp. CA-258035 TaxID=2981138 RepID=UPI0024BD2512|nr:glycoside hydrolase family 18 protein [Crossiella sp. CA-258035]WHT20289.1 glycoside hydrolase family 18 protein [Crossiella sp. CA-258035]
MRTTQRRGRIAAVVVTTLAGLLASLGPAAVAEEAAAEHWGQSQRRVGYYTQWSAKQFGYTVNKLVSSGTAGKLTHLNYAFGNVSEEGKCFASSTTGLGDAKADYQRLHTAAESVDGVADQPGQALAGNFNQLRKLKKKYPHLKVNISLGGWTWSKYFSNAVLTDASRKAFVKSCVDLYLKGNLPKLDGLAQGGDGAAAGLFDGIDLDWEWPGAPGAPGNVVRPEDKQNFTLALAEFRRQFAELSWRTGKRYELTAFLPAGAATVDAGIEVLKVFRLLDFATIQGYDIHGAWDSLTNHQSAIHAPDNDPTPGKLDLDQVIKDYLDRGAPRRSLVLGVPFYGRGWTGVTGGGNGLFQPATGCAPSSHECGYLNYNKIKELTGFTQYRDPKAATGWLFDGNTFWNFEDPVSIKEKTRYIRQQRLGGAMVWSLDGDTGNGELFAAIHRGLS